MTDSHGADRQGSRCFMFEQGANMTREEFLLDIEEIVSAPLFVGENEQEEIANNMWQISVSAELAKALTVVDFSIFLERVISNRKEQIRQTKSAPSMLFYLWFDEQASQIRFNIISNRGTGLPFACETALINEYGDILKGFLEHSCHDGIPIENMMTIGFDYDSEEKCYDKDCSLKIYCVTL